MQRIGNDNDVIIVARWVVTDLCEDLKKMKWKSHNKKINSGGVGILNASINMSVKKHQQILHNNDSNLSLSSNNMIFELDFHMCRNDKKTSSINSDLSKSLSSIQFWDQQRDYQTNSSMVYTCNSRDW